MLNSLYFETIELTSYVYITSNKFPQRYLNNMNIFSLSCYMNILLIKIKQATVIIFD